MERDPPFLHQPPNEPIRDTQTFGCAANVEQGTRRGDRRKSLGGHDDQPGSHDVSRGELSNWRSLAATDSRSWYKFGTWRREEGVSDESKTPSDLVFWWRGQDLNLRPSGYERAYLVERHSGWSRRVFECP